MTGHKPSPWTWVPSLYFAEGFPYTIVTTLSVIMFKQLGLTNSEIVLYTSWFYLPWVIKPLWSPFVDIVKNKRWWLLLTQTLLGAGLGAVALTINTTHFIQLTLAILWLLAFSSATHDISIDGFYMLALDEGDQSLFVGIRNTAYRVSMIAGQGGLLYVVGRLQREVSIPLSWSIIFCVSGAVMLMLACWHSRMLQRPATDMTVSGTSAAQIMRSFMETFESFFKKRHIFTSLLFILLYRFPEAQLVKIAPLFLSDSALNGGLVLTPEQLGLAQGTLGVMGLLAGGIAGGALISKYGLGKCLWPMVMVISLPDLVYVYLSFFPTGNMWVISFLVFMEQLGYGIGFTGYTLFMIYFARGPHQTSHYALCTGFMSLGMMLPGMISGWLQESLGYRQFFIWIMLSCLVTAAVSALIKFEPEFGKKKPEFCKKKYSDL